MYKEGLNLQLILGDYKILFFVVSFYRTNIFHSYVCDD